MTSLTATAFYIHNVTKLRNKLQVRSTEAILQIRYGLIRRELSRVNFHPTDYMLQHFFDKGAVAEVEDDEIVGLEC